MVRNLDGYSAGGREWQNEYTRLVPVEDCEALLAAMAAEPTNCPRPQDYARRLLSCYRAADYMDPDEFVLVIAACFGSYPETFAKRVCHPIHGLPGKLKWPPSVAEVVEALKAEDGKRREAEARAKWTLAEHRRRREERAMEAERTINKAEMARKFEGLKTCLKTMSKA